MGVGSALCGGAPSSGCEARCGGSARRESGIVRRSGRRRERKWVLRSRSCVDSWKRLDQQKRFLLVSMTTCAAVPSSNKSKEQLAAEVMFA